MGIVDLKLTPDPPIDLSDLHYLKPKRRRQKSKRCQYPGCSMPSRHTHHVTYEPEVTTQLCKNCHENITIVNTNVACDLGRKLTNRERLEVWNDWTEGRVHPKLTLEALNWISRWR